MLFATIEDFFKKAEDCRAPTRQEERELALRMQQGDPEARQRLIEGYLPMAARYVKSAAPHYQTLRMALHCTAALEKAVDSFNFLQDSETFAHRLSWHLRNAVTACIAET